MMDDFNRLVSEQLETMERLLFLQTEIERCQEIEKELAALEQETELIDIRREIREMKRELKDIHSIFEQQTEELIQSYQKQMV